LPADHNCHEIFQNHTAVQKKSKARKKLIKYHHIKLVKMKHSFGAILFLKQERRNNAISDFTRDTPEATELLFEEGADGKKRTKSRRKRNYQGLLKMDKPMRNYVTEESPARFWNEEEAKCSQQQKISIHNQNEPKKNPIYTILYFDDPF